MLVTTNPRGRGWMWRIYGACYMMVGVCPSAELAMRAADAMLVRISVGDVCPVCGRDNEGRKVLTGSEVAK